ncbi:MAG: hypothetical protein JWQ80_3199 [Massilia sp.]|nr:hypothetical protein [Massilia sp.]
MHMAVVFPIGLLFGIGLLASGLTDPARCWPSSTSRGRGTPHCCS